MKVFVKENGPAIETFALGTGNAIRGLGDAWLNTQDSITIGVLTMMQGADRISAMRGSANAACWIPAHSRTISSSSAWCAGVSFDARMPSG